MLPTTIFEKQHSSWLSVPTTTTNVLCLREARVGDDDDVTGEANASRPLCVILTRDRHLIQIFSVGKKVLTINADMVSLHHGDH
jgi:hypothetical protein